MRNDRAKLDQIDDADSGGLLSRLFAEEEEFDRRTFWRLGSWGAATVLAVAGAMMVLHYSSGREHERMVEVSRQSQQLQAVERETKTENRRLSAAIETLNNDRDRLFARVTVVEQSLDSVTGALAKPSSASWPKSGAAPVVGTPAIVASAAPIPAAAPPALPEVTLPVTASAHLPPLPTAKVAAAPEPAKPDTKVAADASAASSRDAPLPHEEGVFGALTVASLAPLKSEPAKSDAIKSDVPEAPLEKTIKPAEFGVDLGSANSVEGLRAVWRGALKRVPSLVGSLQPLIVVREGQNGLGLRLHLVAGPLNDAAAAAKLYARLVSKHQRCEQALFDGRRLALETPLGARVPREQPRHQARSQTHTQARAQARTQTEKRVEEPPQQQPQSPQPAPDPAQSRGFSFFNR